MLKQYLQFKLSQKLSPQQIQLMKLIQLPTQAFEQRLKQELEENPALDTGKEEKVDEYEDMDNTKDEFDDNETIGDEINVDDYLSDDEIPDTEPALIITVQMTMRKVFHMLLGLRLRNI